MTIFQKFGLSFVAALTLHFIIIASFGFNSSTEKKIDTQKPLPEIIKASILDDVKIQQEADRLKAKEDNKRIATIKRQQTLENNRIKEQNLLREAKKKREQEERKSQILADKHKKQVIQEKKRIAEVEKLKVLEAARLAKVKQKKIAEKKRLDDLKVAEKKRLDSLKAVEKKRADALKKAEEIKQEQIRQAEAKKQQALLAKKKQQAAEKAEKEALLKKQQAAKNAQIAQDKKSTISISAAIQKKVIAKWIRPFSSVAGLNCTIRVKLLPSGDVMDAQVIRGSDDNIFDKSAINAVRKASPLPVPKSRALFSREFRTFTFTFKPK